MPYLTGIKLYYICHNFGMTDIPSGSRLTYVEAFIQFVINNDRCDELLRYLFDLDKFKNPQSISDMVTVVKLHNQIVSFAKINLWDNGYIEVMAKYKHKKEEVEEYIDLDPILKNLLMNRDSFLKPIKIVRIEYV